MASESYLNPWPEEFLDTDDLLWIDAVDTAVFDLEALHAKAEKHCRRHKWRVGPAGSILTDEPKRSCILRQMEGGGSSAESNSDARLRHEVDSRLQVEDKATYDWSVMPEVKELGEQLFERYCDEAESAAFDYCLVNLYTGPTDKLGWHADNEAGDTSIVSVSLGAAREFGVRPKGGTNSGTDAPDVPLSMLVSGGRSARQVGPVTYLTLESGDVVVMKPGAQERMEHRVCSGKKGDGWRINLTFRQDR